MPDQPWPNWHFDSHPIRYKRSMRNLARYANPAQLRGLGLGLGQNPLNAESAGDPSARTLELAERLIQRDVSYTVEPFNAWAIGGQILRTTSELLEGSGTCLDFAVSLAALCLQEGIPVTIAVAVPDPARRTPAHAFLIVQDAREDDLTSGNGAGDSTYFRLPFAAWLDAFEGGPSGVVDHLIDPTPLPELAGTLDERNQRTMDWLRKHRGTGLVCTVSAKDALHEAARATGTSGFYALPPAGRDLSITAWLPDIPPDTRKYPSRAALWADSPTGNTLIIGPKGSGKSTLALRYAQQAQGGRGWFLDGSDPSTLSLSLANAEAQCQGVHLGNHQKESIDTMAARARARLARTAQPWVVVVDNAECPPKDLLHLLPEPGPHQALILTTTREDWTATGAWREVRLGPLERRDLDAAESRLNLGDEELLPGLVRIACHCDPKFLAEATDPPGPARLVRAALSIQDDDVMCWQQTDLSQAVAAAAFMPAEEVTVGWLATAVFSGDTDRARQAVQRAAERGLIEYSRRSVGARDDDEAALWMHRLVRTAVRELREGEDADIGLSVLTMHRADRRRQRYSPEELRELRDFLGRVPESMRTHLYAQAATAVMDLLEPMGSTAVDAAAALAEQAQPYLWQEAPDFVDLLCTMLMARARRVNHKPDTTATEISDAIEFCQEAIAATGESDERSYVLLRGRAEAMWGILLRKEANSDRHGETARIDLLERVIAVLERSYLNRRAALTDPADPTGKTLLADPDQHVDRGWYNLGGANVSLADAVRLRSPERLPNIYTEALKAYAGSLSLRLDLPDRETLYAAASYWGVALVTYLAAIRCPGELDLSEVVPTPELDLVRRQQTRETLLRAAEETAIRSLAIRADIDTPTGRDTKKSRDLLRKVSLAWPMAGPDDAAILTGLRKALAPVLKDHDLESSAVPPPGTFLVQSKEI